MSRKIVWLQSEIKAWAHEGIIDDNTAQSLSARYSEAQQSSWALFLLTAVGAIIFGLGVILFFAYNWAELPKFAKIALVLMSLFIAHALALLIRFRQPGNHNLIEGFHLLGTMMFGAGIWLIAQIYNIDEHYPTAFLIWGAGALALAWAVPSVIQGLVACLLLSVWGCSELFDFNNLHFTSTALVALGVLPLAWIMQSRILLAVALFCSLGLLLINAGYHLNSTIVAYMIISLSMLLIAAAYITIRSTFPGSADVLRGIGVAVYGLCLFSMTFMSETFYYYILIPAQSEQLSPLVAALHWGLLLSVLILWLVVFFLGVTSSNKINVAWSKSAQHFLLVLSALVLVLQAYGLFAEHIRLLTLIYNAILAMHCVLLIIRGTDNLAWRQVTIGCVTLAILVYVRFNDLFNSLLLRSLVFLLIGAMLFLIGHLYAKRKTHQQKQAQESMHGQSPTQGQGQAHA